MEDYPSLFRRPGKLYAHPDDYIVCGEPIQPDFFLYKAGLRSRLFMRISIKLDEAQFVSATFLLDTRCCPHVDISSRLHGMTKSRIFADGGEDYLSTSLMARNSSVLLSVISQNHIVRPT